MKHLLIAFALSFSLLLTACPSSSEQADSGSVNSDAATNDQDAGTQNDANNDANNIADDAASENDAAQQVHDAGPGNLCEHDDIYEPNNGAAAAADISLPADLSLQSCDAEDWFKFTLPAGKNLKVDLLFAGEEMGLDLDLYLYRADDVQNSISNGTSDNANEQIGFAAQASDTDLLLQIANFAEDPARYQLVISFVEAPNNESCAEALPLDFDTTVTGSTIGASNSNEFASDGSCIGHSEAGADVAYSLTVPAGQSVSVDFDSPGDLGLYLVEDCASLCCWAGTNEGYEGESELLQYHNGSAQDLNMFLIIDAYSAEVASEFSLSASLVESGGESLEACLVDQ